MTHVFASARWRRIFFWCLIVILAALTVKDVYQLFVEYAEGETEADMNMVFNMTMSMPNFTFCIPISMVNTIYNSTKFKKKVDFGGKVSNEEAVKKSLATMKNRKTFLSKDWDRHMIKDAIGTIGMLHSLERETDDSFVARDIQLLKKKDKTDHKLRNINFWIRQIKARNVTFAEFVQKAGTEVLKRMIKKSNRISPLDDKEYASDYKITWISEGDICFQPIFDEKANFDIKASGNFYNLMMNHDPENFEDDLHCIVVDMNGRPANLERFVDSGGHTKDGVSDELCPGSSTDLIVEVRASYQILENDEKGTACMDFQDDEDSSEFNCRSRCRMNLIRSICGCSPITIEELVEPEELEQYPICNYAKCNVDVQTAAKSEKGCIHKCLRTCNQIRYNINLVGSKESTARKGSDDEPAKALYQTQVNLAWGSFEYFRLEQNYKFDSIENFFSEIGGAIGIWLGLSILSLIQGTGYIMELMAGRCSSERSESDGEDEDGEDDRKFSQNPIGKPTLSSNPLGDIAAPQRKRTSAGGPPPY